MNHSALRHAVDSLCSDDKLASMSSSRTSSGQQDCPFMLKNVPLNSTPTPFAINRGKKMFEKHPEYIHLTRAHDLWWHSMKTVIDVA